MSQLQAERARLERIATRDVAAHSVDIAFMADTLAVIIGWMNELQAQANAMQDAMAIREKEARR